MELERELPLFGASAGAADPGRRPEPGRNPALPGRRDPPGRNLGVSTGGVEVALPRPGGGVVILGCAAAASCSFCSLARASSSRRSLSAFSSASLRCCSANSICIICVDMCQMV